MSSNKVEMTDEEYKIRYQTMYKDYIDFEDPSNTVNKYSDGAHRYEQEIEALGYSTPKHIARMTLELLGANNISTARILDAGCGTGLVADHLLNLGFKGTLDGFDGGAKMVEIAAKKNIYSRVETMFLVRGKESVDFESSKYDACVASGVFTMGHVYPTALKELIRCLKPGGIMLFTSRKNPQGMEYFNSVVDMVNSIEAEGTWKKIKVVEEEYFDRDCCTQNVVLGPDGKPPPVKCNVFCYRKA